MLWWDKATGQPNQGYGWLVLRACEQRADTSFASDLAEALQGQGFTIREFAEPGIPEGMVGREVADPYQTANTMGIEFHQKKVLVFQNSDVTEGAVISAKPPNPFPLQVLLTGWRINGAVLRSRCSYRPVNPSRLL